MNQPAILKVQERTETNTRANKRIRKIGYLPGSIYGKGLESIPVSVKTDELRKVLTKHGRNSVLKLDLSDKKSYNVMVKDIHLAPVSGEYLHAEFHQISLSEEVKTNVAFVFIGRDLVEQRRLILLSHMDTLAVKGLPQDIPNSIEVDVSELQAGESVSVSELILPEGITTEVDSDLKVVTINEPKTQIIEEDSADESEAADEENAEEKNDEEEA